LRRCGAGDPSRTETPRLDAGRVRLLGAWCGPCRALGPAVEQEVEKRATGLELAKPNIGAEPVIAGRYGIQGVPAIAVFRDGQVVTGFVGAYRRSAASYEQVLATRPKRRRPRHVQDEYDCDRCACGSGEGVPDAFAGEGGIERCRELTVSIVNQEARLAAAIVHSMSRLRACCSIPAVSGLLGYSCRPRARCGGRRS
jgi:thiol-disulfide isomerase/thioredoxin